MALQQFVFPQQVFRDNLKLGDGGKIGDGGERVGWPRSARRRPWKPLDCGPSPLAMRTWATRDGVEHRGYVG